MTRPLWKSDRTRLMIGCGSAALALAMVLAPQRAAAQGIQAAPTVVSGSATVTSPVANTTRIDVSSQTAVIDWTPFLDNSGNALSFLPTGSTANFRGNTANFAVLNRILPTTNNNIAVIDGSVLSQFGNPSSGLTTGGFIAFYSPTGILVGPNAKFDVGSLMLTTLDTTPASFDNFVNGGFLSLQGQQGSRATITVSPGAQITATRENSFFTIVAADVEMRGTALVNGSHAYVAGEVVDMRFSNGLFDIFVSAGTAASGEVVTLNGTIGGPSSNGVGDDHMIYAVARASQDPISMLLSGNIGFAPAQSAGIINGEIILAANYNVFGRDVNGGSISEGIDATFNGNSELSTVRADIVLENFIATSSVLAIGNGETIARGESRVRGNLLLVGQIGALIDSNSVDNFTIDGDVLVDARDYGVASSSLQSLDAINATGGSARILSRAGSRLTIGGNALVTADAFGGADTLNRIAGTTRGGLAEINAEGGRIQIDGSTTLHARAFGNSSVGFRTGAVARGGIARFAVSNGGEARLGGDLQIRATAIGSDGDSASPSTVSNAFGGTAQIVLSGTGNMGVSGEVFIEANAGFFGFSAANALTGGAPADAGEASVIINGTNELTIDGGLSLIANARGADNVGGKGGLALGGAARAVVTGGGRITVSGISTTADAFGGAGTSGGDAFGGIAGANAISGTIEILGLASASAVGRGGGANFGFSGNGGIGRGGRAFFQADGTSSSPARLTIADFVSVGASGFGGNGGQAGEGGFTAGTGGDGFGGEISTPNQADPAFGNGAFLLAGGDYGTLSVTGTSFVGARGVGGQGGSPLGLLAGGKGGNGFGGLAQVGLALLGGPGTVGGGSATFSGDLFVDASGLGGDGGGSGPSSVAGDGGTGTGGDALLTVLAGDVIINRASLTANGFGGSGATGGDGRGGVAKVLGGLDGVLNATGLDITAQGFGGFALSGRGGSGFGGTAGFEIDGISATIEGGDLIVDASGNGADSSDGASGDGTGGTAYISSATGRGTLLVSGHTSVFANGLGADSRGAFAAGNGRGGTAYIDAFNGSTMNFNTAQIAAVGRGGEAADHEGGDGFGGTVRLQTSGAGSSVFIDRNVSQSVASESPAGDALLNADGIGRATFGGDGMGGNGQGGSVGVFARGGGIIELPSAPLADPESVGVIRVRANGIGGGSAVEGGIGGFGGGGGVDIDVDGQGSSLIMGDANFTVFSQGGSSLDEDLNITGGSAVGGRRSIRVFNGGSLSLASFGGQTEARGGDGTEAGNGGSARSGRNTVQINGGTLAFTGILALRDDSTGGTGARGGDALATGEGGGVEFSATNATIRPTFDGQGLTGITVEAIATGGAGTTGGNAETNFVFFGLQNTNITNGILRVRSEASGGNAAVPGGTGGNAVSGNVGVVIRDSALNMNDDIAFLTIARGGAQGIQGGSARSGEMRVALNNSTVAVRALNTARATMQVQSFAVGGTSDQAGDATSRLALLEMTNAAIRAGELTIESGAGGLSQSAGGIGGTARADRAQVVIQGASLIDAGVFGLFSNANTTGAGRASGGVSSLTVAPGSQTQITANRLVMVSDGVGSTAANGNVAGQFDITVASGSINAGELFASARGNQSSGVRSQIIAQGGNLNVSGAFNAFAFGDILLRTGQGGVIGSTAPTGNTTAIRVTADGNIETIGDGSAGSGISGQTINLLAGRSILLGGAMTGRGGPITLTANRGGGQALSPVPASIITMAQGSRIDAGTGTVTVRLLDGGSDPQRAGGAITLASISAGRIDVRNLGLTAGSNIGVRADGVLTASGSGRAIDLASLGGEVINLAGDAGLVLTGGGHYGVFAATPTGSQIGSFANYARRYNVANAAAYDTLNPGGNFAAFRIVPFLTVTAAAASRVYGNANPTFTASFAGFLPGDGIGSLSGTPQFTTLATGTSNVGQFAINAALGSLLSAQGYQFTFAPGVLNVTPRPLTVTANNLSRLFGTANPPLTFTIGGLGLVNGDQLSGDLATTANVTTRVGTAPITQGALAASANYALTFVDGTLTIEAPPAPPGINNPTNFVPPIRIGDQPPPIVDEDEQRFGIDFPESLETPLISEDPLLDDPVTSGGDASVYGDTAAPAGGGK